MIYILISILAFNISRYINIVTLSHSPVAGLYVERYILNIGE